jgi:hypothetical protein
MRRFIVFVSELIIAALVCACVVLGLEIMELEMQQENTERAGFYHACVLLDKLAGSPAYPWPGMKEH